MKYSKLKHDLEVLELTHKHEIQLLQMQHSQAKNELLNKCKHTYEDGSTAKTTIGMQWDSYQSCKICGKSV